MPNCSISWPCRPWLRLLPPGNALLLNMHGGHADVRTEGTGWHGNKGGEMSVDTPGQHVLERTSCLISNQASLSCDHSP